MAETNSNSPSSRDDKRIRWRRFRQLREHTALPTPLLSLPQSNRPSRFRYFAEFGLISLVSILIAFFINKGNPTGDIFLEYGATAAALTAADIVLKGRLKGFAPKLATVGLSILASTIALLSYLAEVGQPGAIAIGIVAGITSFIVNYGLLRGDERTYDPQNEDANNSEYSVEAEQLISEYKRLEDEFLPRIKELKGLMRYGTERELFNEHESQKNELEKELEDFERQVRSSLMIIRNKIIDNVHTEEDFDWPDKIYGLESSLYSIDNSLLIMRAKAYFQIEKQRLDSEAHSRLSLEQAEYKRDLERINPNLESNAPKSRLTD